MDEDRPMRKTSKSRGNWRMDWCSRVKCWNRELKCGKCIRFSEWDEGKRK